MTHATVALALHTELDMAAVRRLHDYGTLDDANVARAYEQVRIQRVGRQRRCDWPRYLCRVTHLAAVVAHNEAVRLVSVDAREDEAIALRTLFDCWPQGNGHTVFWREDAAAVLGTRAFMHEARVAPGLAQWPRVALAGQVIDGIDPAEGDEAEREMARLLDGRPPPTPPGERVDGLAINRYRWWLRWQYSQGAIDAERRKRLEASLSGSSAAHRVGS